LHSFCLAQLKHAHHDLLTNNFFFTWTRQLDDEFSSLLLKISDRKNQLQLLEEKLTQIAKTKEQKGHDLRMLERKLVVLLEAQENELAAIRSRQQKKENSILKQTGAASKTNAMSTQHVELKPAGTASQQVSTFDSSNASKLMESTEAMMKFGFTSMSMTYFTALNMVKAMKSMSNQDIPLSSSEQISATLPGLQHSSENQSVQSMYTKKMKSPVSYWSVDHVVEWLKALSLGQYEDSFRDGSVDGPFLCELTDDDLMNVLGVEHKLHRKKLLLGISRLQSLNSNEGTTDTKNEIQMSSTVSQRFFTYPIFCCFVSWTDPYDWFCFKSMQTAASSLSSPLKSQATTSLKGSSVDITSSSSKVNLQQPLKLQNVERERTTGEVSGVLHILLS
jgi:SAM domain (Sterile alpha motif).